MDGLEGKILLKWMIEGSTIYGNLRIVIVLRSAKSYDFEISRLPFWHPMLPAHVALSPQGGDTELLHTLQWSWQGLGELKAEHLLRGVADVERGHLRQSPTAVSGLGIPGLPGLRVAPPRVCKLEAMTQLFP